MNVVEQTAPADVAELAALVRSCAEDGRTVRAVGSGYDAGLGNPVSPNVVIHTASLASIRDFDPDELVIRLEAGTPVGELEALLAAHGLRSTVAAAPSGRTVGGALAAAASSPLRLRHGPVRNHVIGLALVTGSGDVVRAGGQVVKNVTGFDLSRLAVGSLGRLGIIVEVALRVFPIRGRHALIRLGDPEVLNAQGVRPLGVVATRTEVTAIIEGPDPIIDQITASVGGTEATSEGLPDASSWRWRASLRSRPAEQPSLLELLPASWEYVAQLQTGMTEVGGESLVAHDAAALRLEAEARGGRFVLHRVPDAVRDELGSWGKPPPDLEIQRRIVASFDPARICNPGILPGGL